MIALMIEYHDKEWGVPLHNDRKLFEFLLLEGMQAGLAGEQFYIKGKTFARHLITLILIKLQSIVKEGSTLFLKTKA